MNQLAAQQNTNVSFGSNQNRTASDLAAILTPTTFEEALHFADMICQSGMVPKDYIGKPGAVMVAMQMGAEVGLKPLQAIQNISNINGRPSLWGDAVLALVKTSPLCEFVEEEWDEATKTATCIMQRKGDRQPIIRSFSEEDARKAGLLTKAGPWQTYRNRMIQMRARGFCARDTFPDLLRGLSVAEEILHLDEDLSGEKSSAPAQNSSKVADLTARLAAPVQREPLVQPQVVQRQMQPEPEPVPVQQDRGSDRPTQQQPVQQDNGVERMQQASAARKQAMQDQAPAPEAKTPTADKLDQINQLLIEPQPVSDKDKFALEMVLEAINTAKNKAELMEIADDARSLHPDLQLEARKAYQTKVNTFHRK